MATAGGRGEGIRLDTLTVEVREREGNPPRWIAQEEAAIQPPHSTRCISPGPPPRACAQQLTQLKERLNGELQQFGRSGQQLAVAANKFEDSRESVAALSRTKEGAGPICMGRLPLPCTPAMQGLHMRGQGIGWRHGVATAF